MSTINSGQANHLIIVGGGSAAFAAAIRASEIGARATIVNDGLPIGGTCVNVGCVPSKTLLRAAEAYHRAAHPGFEGVTSKASIESFSRLIAGKNELVDHLRRTKYVDLAAALPGIRVIDGRARLTSPTSIEVDGDTIEGDRLLVATGVRPALPPIPGLRNSGYLTNETAFELDRLPDSLLVLGGRYVALETAQLFARLGTKVTIVQRSEAILPDQASDLTDALASYLGSEGIDIVTGATVSRVIRQGDGVRVEADSIEGPRSFEATHLLAALGRTPNTAGMGLREIGVQLSSAGYIEVDSTLRTAVNGIAAAGDVIGDPMFVYTAAYEGALAAENLLRDQTTPTDYTALPWVVFTDPQVAGIGMDQAQADESGLEAETATLPLKDVPRAQAARDTRGFIRLIRDKQTDRLVGARILAPEGGELLMEISMAIQFGITVEQVSSSFHPYLTLSEGIKLAAITFGKDVSKLSCCAA